MKKINDKKHISLNDLPDHVAELINKEGNEIIKILKQHDPRVSFSIIVAVATNYLYMFDNPESILEKIEKSIEITLKKWQEEDK